MHARSSSRAANAERAGVAALVRFERARSRACGRSAPAPGLDLHQSALWRAPRGCRRRRGRGIAELGRCLREHFVGWDAAILTAAPEAARELHLRSYRVHELWNGPIAVPAAAHRSGRARRRGSAAAAAATPAARGRIAASPGAQMFANRLQKNSKRLGKLARRAAGELLSALRRRHARVCLRDRSLCWTPRRDAVHLLVQEYAAPASIELEAAQRRRREALAALPVRARGAARAHSSAAAPPQQRRRHSISGAPRRDRTTAAHGGGGGTSVPSQSR